MNARKRVQQALDHQEPDRVPVDFGATPTSGIAASLLYRIKKHYGLLKPDERIFISEPYQLLGRIDADVRQLLGIDVVGITPRKNMFGFRNEGWKPWQLCDGTPVWVPELFNTEPDADGRIPMYAEGDRSFPPSAIMPANGYYFDSTDRQKPQERLDPADNTEEFSVLAEDDLNYYRQAATDAYEQHEQAVMMVVPGAAFGDIALVPAPFLKNPKGIRGIMDWYMALAEHPDYIREMFRMQAEVALENLRLLYSAVGDKVQIVFMSGTDFGSQSSTITSRRAYRDLFMPFQKQLNDWVHKNTPWKTFMHSCGAVEPLIGDFVEAGFDILNPVQCSATGMGAEGLKAKYGDQIVFWGGGVNTQKTMPYGTPEEVKAEVSERLRVFKPHGGFVFNSIHNLQSDVPIENFVAMMDAIRENASY